MTNVPTIELNDGARHPPAGLRRVPDRPRRDRGAVKTALDIGYRHIDTAEMYRNEKGVGQGIRDSGLDRSEVFVTSKLNNGFHEPDDARRAFDETLAALGFDYVDLFLIHWPLPTLYDGDFVSTWKMLEEFKRRRPGPQHRRVELPDRASRAPGRRDRHRARGQPDRGSPVLRQRRGARLRPAARHRDRGVVAHRAGQGARRPGRHPIAEATGKSPAQVVLRWHIQRGDIVFPKSVTPQRIKENFELFDFELERRRRRCDLGARQGRGRPDRARTRTRSTTSRADRADQTTNSHAFPRGACEFVSQRRKREPHGRSFTPPGPRASAATRPCARLARRRARTAAMADFRPRRSPGPSSSNIRSLRVSGASSAVSRRYLSGSDSLAMVRHVLPYCTRNEPVV